MTVVMFHKIQFSNKETLIMTFTQINIFRCWTVNELGARHNNLGGGWRFSHHKAVGYKDWTAHLRIAHRRGQLLLCDSSPLPSSRFVVSASLKKIRADQFRERSLSFLSSAVTTFIGSNEVSDIHKPNRNHFKGTPKKGRSMKTTKRSWYW